MTYPNILFLSLSLVLSSLAQASEKNILLRLDRLERMVQYNSQSKVLTKLKHLQQENQELRSQLEEIIYQNDKLKNRLHSLNEDMDRRVLALESDQDDFSNQSEPDKENRVQISTNKKADETSIQDINSSEDAELSFIEQKAYQSAFNELKAQRYGKAGESFRLFLQEYPDSSYSHLAQYWLAESSYAQRKFKLSIKNYNDLLVNHPNSQKKPEAILKIAYCHYELGEKKAAKVKLKELIKNYPNSTEAGQAKRLLKKI